MDIIIYKLEIALFTIGLLLLIRFLGDRKTYSREKKEENRKAA